jgi:hypothetical protein
LNLTRARVIWIGIAILNLSLAGCVTPEAVSKFTGSAAATLTSAKPVFNDMELSCLREVNSKVDFGTFQPPAVSDPHCKRIGTQAAGAVAAAKILSDYFSAINSLASFGNAKAGTEAETLLAKTGAAFGADSAAQTALGSIARVLTSAATAGYQQKQLEKDLTKVSGNIPTVTNALKAIVKDVYIDTQLVSEQDELSIRYQRFVKDNSTKNPLSPEAKLMLDDRWHADQAALEAKRASAQCLVSALEALSKGFQELAASSHQLTAKEVPGLLGPYATQLQALIPQIQKAF